MNSCSYVLLFNYLKYLKSVARPPMEFKNTENTCQVHAEALTVVKAQMRSRELLLELAEVFKVLGDHTRVQILNALSLSEMCVCSLAELLDMSSSAISHQLRILRNARIVTYRKDGKHVYYSLDDRHVENLMREGLDHLEHA